MRWSMVNGSQVTEAEALPDRLVLMKGHLSCTSLCTRAAEIAKWTAFKKEGVWAGEMAQWMKCALCKSEGQSLGPRVM